MTRKRSDRAMSVMMSMVLSAGLLVLSAGPAAADPLDWEVLKFQQLPLDGLTGPTGKVYYGHNEPSTAWSIYVDDGTGPAFVGYDGNFMADDFADRAGTPVVHVRWWGSYLSKDDSQPVDKFLFAWETDVPASETPLNFSHPGDILGTEIVSRGALAPASGTFTEKLVTGVPPAAEELYVYNAELALPFSQEPNTIYWLKIVALVDLNPTETALTEWGWHDRDWTVEDTLASTIADGVDPGEFKSTITADGDVDVWHFQDDAVSGKVFIDPFVATGPFVLQDWHTFESENYIEGADGPSGISNFSKDLAFELYTVPEPTTMGLLAIGLVGVVARRRKRRAGL